MQTWITFSLTAALLAAGTMAGFAWRAESAVQAPSPKPQPGPLRAGGEPVANVLNIAHRGASAFAPENTMEAFRKAADLGCHLIELDVHFSKDNELIVIHDDDLNRCSDVKSRFPNRKSYFVSDF